MLMRLVRIAEGFQDRAGILIVTGVAGLIFFHVAINIGMALGILPAIGIPLPLISYGGSSTLTTFVAIGLALSVYYRRFLLTSSRKNSRYSFGAFSSLSKDCALGQVGPQQAPSSPFWHDHCSINSD